MTMVDTFSSPGAYRYPAGSVLIYFYGEPDESIVKFGKTTGDPAKRGKAHSRRGGAEVSMRFLIGVLGQDSDEKVLINRWAHLRTPVGNEWVHATDEVKDYLRWLSRQSFASLTREGCQSLRREPDSTSWLPGNGHEVCPSGQLELGEPWDWVRHPHLTADDFYTSPRIIEAARDLMGCIDLDPASHPVANTVVRATRFFTHDDNGLERHWAGKVWVNPPFGQWESWSNKIIHEWRRGDVAEMCVLAATRSITAQCFAPLLQNTTGMVVFRGRIPFWGERATSSPDDGHVVLYFGRDYDRFVRCFGSLGTTFGMLS